MDFFSFIKKNSLHFKNRLLFFFALAGTFNFCIIAIVISSIVDIDSGIPFLNMILLCISIVIFIYAQNIALTQSAKIVEEIIANIRLRLTGQIRQSELLAFEKIGKTRYHTILTQETTTISNTSKLITRCCSALSMMVIACIYIGYLSLPALLTAIFTILYGVRIYKHSIEEYQSRATIAYKEETYFFTLMKHYFDGFKEIKINLFKNTNLFNNYLRPAAQKAQEAKLHAASQLNTTVIFAQVYFYILLGIMIFVFPKLITIDSSSLLQITALLLFITSGPLGDIVETLPLLEKSSIAIHNLEALENELRLFHQTCILSTEPLDSAPPFESISLTGIEFGYQPNNEKNFFHIGPVDFYAKRGEIIFIMGGNGSGKTTLLKVLTGLYSPNDGTMTLNNIPIGPGNRNLYRSVFSPIFQDMHLFDRLYGVGIIDKKKSDALLTEMHLFEKTSILEDGSITHIQLSAGQKKRLALVLSEFENREVYIFDEWAADQDPMFRRYFYQEYIRNLAKRGKTVIAVTHDDHYYSMADRIYRMDYGILKEISNKIAS